MATQVDVTGRVHEITSYMLGKFRASLAARTHGPYVMAHTRDLHLSSAFQAECDEIVEAMVTAFLNPCEQA